jgi:hypothetical protein
MRVAAENSKRGREIADLSISYRKVLSPINVVPSADDMERVTTSGREETAPYIPFLKKMLSGIEGPPSVD